MDNEITTCYTAEQVMAARRKVEQAMVDTLISRINAHMDDEDKTLVAFTPLVVEALAWQFADNVAFSVKYPVKCSETKTLSRELETAHGKYDKFMRCTLDVAHCKRIQRRKNEMIKQFEEHFLQLTMAVRNLVLQTYADRIETRTNAFMSICMLDLLDKLTEHVDTTIRQRTATNGYSVANPWIKTLRKLMLEFVGERRLTADFNVKIGINVLLQDVKTVKYLDPDEETLPA
jgi:hypothetical protein